MIYDLFNDHVSIADYALFNDLVAAYFRLSARHSPGDVENHETPRQDNRCPTPNANTIQTYDLQSQLSPCLVSYSEGTIHAEYKSLKIKFLEKIFKSSKSHLTV